MKETFHFPHHRNRLTMRLEEVAAGGEWAITIAPWKKDRSLEQNSISHAWYAQISRAQREYSPDEVKRICKLRYGLPLLRADDEDYNEFCCHAVDPLSYEDQVRAMRYVPVTRLMSTAQMSEYLEEIQRRSVLVDLRFPGE